MRGDTHASRMRPGWRSTVTPSSRPISSVMTPVSDRPHVPVIAHVCSVTDEKGLRITTPETRRSTGGRKTSRYQRNEGLR